MLFSWLPPEKLFIFEATKIWFRVGDSNSGHWSGFNEALLLLLNTRYSVEQIVIFVTLTKNAWWECCSFPCCFHEAWWSSEENIFFAKWKIMDRVNPSSGGAFFQLFPPPFFWSKLYLTLLISLMFHIILSMFQCSVA